MRRHAMLVLALLLIVGGAVAWWLRDDATPAPAPSAVTEVATQTDVAAASATDAPSTEPTREPEAPQRANVAPPPSDDLAVVTGRCIDEGALPIAACSLALRPHSPPAEGWTAPPPTLTAPDGTFAITFAPHADLRIELTLHSPAHVPATIDLGKLAPHGANHLGDVTLLTGVLVSGRITDPEQHPLADVPILLTSAAPPQWRRANPASRGDAVSRADGTFVFAARIVPGPWVLAIDSVERGILVKPLGTLHLQLKDVDAWLDVVVRALDENATIRGVVVDEGGQPVAAASIDLAGGQKIVTFPRGANGESSVSGSDGSFLFVRDLVRGNPPGPFFLLADGKEHAPWRSDAAIAWGTHDVRIVLRRSATLEVRAVTADGGRPVETFGLHVLRADSGARSTSSITQDPHPGGIAEATDLAPGRYLVGITPPRESPLTFSELVPVEFGNVDQVLVVPVPTKSERAVRVTTADGKGVADAQLEVIDTRGGPVPTGQAWSWPIVDATKPVLRDRCRTDGAGRAAIMGPALPSLALRVTPVSHPPLVLPNVQLDDPAELVVVVAQGATIAGRVEPAAIVSELFELAELPVDRPLDDAENVRCPRLIARATARDGVRTERAARIAPDGTFVVEGVPAGDWVLLLHSPARGIGHVAASDHVANVLGLADGERREIVIAVPHLRCARLSGTVTSSSPLAEGKVVLRTGHTRRIFPLDGNGRFTALLRPGTWTLGASFGQGYLDVAPPITLAAGEQVERAFHVAFAFASLRVVGRDREPAQNLAIEFFEDGAKTERVMPARCDAAGLARTGGGAGTYEARTVRRRLLDINARAQFEKAQRGAAAPASPYVSLGAIVLDAVDREQKVVLPDAWYEEN